MNRLLFVAAWVFAGLASGHAEIRFPSSSFDVTTLSDAKAAAEKRQLPLAFVYTDKNTTCSLCRNATGTILQSLRSSAVIVYVERLGGTPGEVSQVLSSKGRFIPKVALLSPDLSKSYGLVTYEEIRAEGDRPLRELKRTARAAE